MEGLFRSIGTYDFGFIGEGGTFGLRNLRILKIPIYYFMMILGIAESARIASRKRNDYGLTGRQMSIYLMSAVVFGIIGALLMGMIQSGTFHFAGLSLFGAIYADCILMPLIAHFIIHDDKWKLMDYFIFIGMEVLIFTRMGCFFNGCCAARRFVFHYHEVRLPAQLYEVIYLLLIMALLLFIEKKQKNHGYVFISFLGLYGFCRFFMEILRNNPKNIGCFSLFQIFSLVSIFFSILLFFIRKRSRKIKNA